MKAALAHHWLVGMRGGEKVLEQIATIFPEAPVYTLISNRSKLSETLSRRSIRNSFLQHLPGASAYYRSLLPVFPLAVRSLTVEHSTTFLFSTDASIIKGLSFPPGIAHVCYCHSPPRYLWDLHETYIAQTTGMTPLKRLVFRALTPCLRQFDFRAAQRVSYFIANSHFVQDRIRRCYGREAAVIFPPVSISDFECERPAEDFYLVVSELVAYKRIDLVIRVFNDLGKKLIIIGHGPEADALQKSARPNITFLGRQPFSVLKDHYERCRALVFPGVEDFGITIVEALAAGRPVIALRAGGALETVIDGRTGILFDEQNPESLAEAIRHFESGATFFDPKAIRATVEHLGPERFRTAVRSFCLEKYPDLFGC